MKRDGLRMDCADKWNTFASFLPKMEKQTKSRTDLLRVLPFFARKMRLTSRPAAPTKTNML